MPPIIDHDPNEPPPDRSKSPWPLLAVIIVLGWIATFALFEINWHSVFLGALTAFTFTAWAIEFTGNRVPPSWRGKPPRSR